MATLEVNEKQLRLIQYALELYSRIGILQIERIMDHPFVEQMVMNQFRPKKDKLEVGDKTERGVIVEIGKSFIKTKGSWGNGEEIKKWKDVENIKLAVNWTEYHNRVEEIENTCSQLKNLISGDPRIYSKNASYGIGRNKEGQYNIDAYDMIQVIRHEFWKANPNRSNMTVDSSICKFGSEPLIKVKLNDNESITTT